MAETQPNQPKPGLAEWGEHETEFWRNVHLGVGSVAVLASAVAAPILIVPFETVGAFELVHGGALEVAHSGLKKHNANKNS